MRQVPDHQCALRLCGFGDRLHVVQMAAAVVHVGQHQDCGFCIDGGGEFLRRVDQVDAVAAIQPFGQALRHVDVGREIVAFGDDYFTGCRIGFGGLHLQCAGQYLEQIDGCGVGHHDFVFAGADQACQLVAQPTGKIEPAGFVPAAYKAVAPFLLDHLLCAL